MQMHRLFLGIGSNQGDREQILSEAVTRLGSLGRVVGISSLIETEPWGFVSSHRFLNAVVELETPLSPEMALRCTQEIEQHLGRTSKSQEGVYRDRPIDIDLLLYDELTLQTDRLTIPHPLLHRRPFVLIPLAELAPNLIHPVLKQPIAILRDKLCSAAS